MTHEYIENIEFPGTRCYYFFHHFEYVRLVIMKINVKQCLFLPEKLVHMAETFNLEGIYTASFEILKYK